MLDPAMRRVAGAELGESWHLTLGKRYLMQVTEGARLPFLLRSEDDVEPFFCISLNSQADDAEGK